MDGFYGQFAERQRALIAQSDQAADARRRYLLDEAAYAISEEFSSVGEKLTFPHISVWESILSDCKRAEKAFLISRLYRHLCLKMNQLSVSDLLLPEERASEGEHIVYVQNFYTERAYEFFAKDLNAPTVSYTSDFTNACAEVGEGLADFCILPFRDERWMPFHSFSRMPEDYGLRVCAVCTVERADGETMRLSLCGRGCRVPKGTENVALELLFSSQNGEDFEDIRCLAESLFARTLFAEALPDRYTASTSWRITYQLETDALAVLLLGRRLLAHESELLGIYKMPLLSDRES